MTDRAFNALVFCTGESARSVIAESILNRDGMGWLRRYSAGSHPSGAVHPLALTVREDLGCPTCGLRSKPRADMQRLAAFVVTSRRLKNRITAFAALPGASVGPASLQAGPREIGRGEGSTSRRPGVE